MMQWIVGKEALLAALDQSRSRMDAADAYVESLSRLEGFCAACDARTVFEVDVGVRLGDHPNLREGLRCPSCGLGNRHRLLADAIHQTGVPAGQRGRVLEATTQLFGHLQARYPWLEGSEYFGPGHRAGEKIRIGARLVEHQNITGLGDRDGSLALLVHNDVIEHVADTDAALRECRRVLAPGGVCVFTMPFFPWRAKTLVRGRDRPDGTIEHLEPPEYHGDGLRSEGIYTYYHFGLDFIDRAEAAGFSRVETGFDPDVFCGYTSNNYRYGVDALMPPVVFRSWA